MQVGTAVTHERGTPVGTVVMRHGNLCLVKWASGVIERIHEEELVVYDTHDPKSDGFHERMSDAWDLREGK